MEAISSLHWQGMILERLKEEKGGPVRRLPGASLFGPWEMGKDFIFVKEVRWYDDPLSLERVFQWRAD